MPNKLHKKKWLLSLLGLIVLLCQQAAAEDVPGARLDDIVIEVVTEVESDLVDGEVDIKDPGQGVQGDCDGDGQLSIADAICAMKMSVGLMPTNKNLDITGDGQVTSGDARVIIQRVP